jgi:hypothetical protein
LPPIAARERAGQIFAGGGAFYAHDAGVALNAPVFRYLRGLRTKSSLLIEWRHQNPDVGSLPGHVIVLLCTLVEKNRNGPLQKRNPFAIGHFADD